ncbi:hypothetical protein PR003_g8864 [Phytophthora rubi]|uniref:Uncharacterized protein n=1 Tax=Phytophthora rubi TaxID=129364 RepID=A0A6A3NWF4_9STRA|nr:hypothetical protein PR002_g6057 [Phytophthora rubi]KAE9047012.1 hypothetical protein PR001_g4370 [Phytophthora rubi]KAE9343662.1 hypothetical protein PR003_g8864 [Phytophthora rubi]
MVDATAADEEPDAHEILLHAVSYMRLLYLLHTATDCALSYKTGRPSGRRTIVRRCGISSSSTTTARLVALLGSDQAAPVVAASSQHRPNVERGALEAGARLARDDVGDVPLNRAESFRRYLCMRRHFFLRVVRAVDDPDDYFQQRHDATEKLGLIAPQKCTAAIR